MRAAVTLSSSVSLAALAALAASAGASAQGAPNFDAVEIKTTQLADGLYMLEGQGGNIAVSVGEDGVLIVDDQFAPLSQKIMDAIAALSDHPVTFVINTHHHVDHTMGNALFPEANVIGHANAKREQERVGTGVLQLLRGRIPELVAELDGVDVRLIEETFDDGLSIGE